MARTESVWEEVLGTYITTVYPAGMDVLINGSNHYLNFGTFSGLTGYGFRDNNGVLEFKNLGDAWTALGGGSSPGGSDMYVQFNDSGVFGGTSGFVFNKATGNVGIGISSPLYRLSVLGQTFTTPDPSNLSVSLVSESLNTGPSGSVGGSIYGPEDTTFGGTTENIPAGSVYVSNGQNWNYTVWAYTNILGTNYISPGGFSINFQEANNDGSSNFTVNVNWNSSSNGDGSGVSGYVIFIPQTGAYVDVGNTLGYLDDGTSSGGTNYSPFGGLQDNGQSVNLTTYLQGTTPSGASYYGNVGSSLNYIGNFNNQSFFWVPITISGTGGTNWGLSDDTDGTNYTGTGDQTFYIKGGGSGGAITTQHYGFLADGSGSQLTTLFQLNNYNPTLNLYSAGFNQANTNDPGDSNYYYISGTQGFGAGTEGKDLIAFNGGPFSIGKITSATSFAFDAFSSWSNGTIITPTIITSPAGYFESESTDNATPTAILNANVSGGTPRLSLQVDAVETVAVAVGYMNSDTGLNLVGDNLQHISNGIIKTKLYSNLSQFNVDQLTGYSFVVKTKDFPAHFQVLNDSNSVNINGGNTSAWLNIGAGTSAKAQFNFATQGTPVTSPNNGDMYFNGAQILLHTSAGGNLSIMAASSTGVIGSGKIPVADANGNFVASSFTTGQVAIGNSSGGLSGSSLLALGSGPVWSFGAEALFAVGAAISNGQTLSIGTGGSIVNFAKTYLARTTSGNFGNGVDTVDVTANSVTITLPTAVGINGRIFTIKNSGVGTVTIATTSSQTVDGTTPPTVASKGSYTFQSTGANWIIISKV